MWYLIFSVPAGLGLLLIWAAVKFFREKNTAPNDPSKRKCKVCGSGIDGAGYNGTGHCEDCSNEIAAFKDMAERMKNIVRQL